MAVRADGEPRKSIDPSFTINKAKLTTVKTKYGKRVLERADAKHKKNSAAYRLRHQGISSISKALREKEENLSSGVLEGLFRKTSLGFLRVFCFTGEA